MKNQENYTTTKKLALGSPKYLKNNTTNETIKGSKSEKENSLSKNTSTTAESKKSTSKRKLSNFMENVTKMRDNCNKKFREADKRVIEQKDIIVTNVEKMANEQKELKKYHNEYAKIEKEKDEDINKLSTKNAELESAVGHYKSKEANYEKKHIEALKNNQKIKEQYQLAVVVTKLVKVLQTMLIF